MTEPLSYPTDADAAAELVDEVQGPAAAADERWSVPVADALELLLVWSQSVGQMRLRILDPSAGRITRQGDIQLFAVAVRQVLRFAELCRAIAPEAARSDIDRALHAFNEASPDAKDIRDVLDHYDDYLRGRGRAFKVGRPGDYRDGFLQVFRPAGSWIEGCTDTVKLHIAPGPGHRLLTLDITREGAAASELVHAVCQALR
jgi:hypothetical protein